MEPADESDDALEAHQTLVESALPLVFDTFDNALGDGVRDPIVVLVDCEDELGGQIARGWLGDEAVEEAILLQHADDRGDGDADHSATTVFARALPWAAARDDLIAAFPYLEDGLSAPPEAGGVLVVGVTAGGASLLTAPDNARGG